MIPSSTGNSANGLIPPMEMSFMYCENRMMVPTWTSPTAGHLPMPPNATPDRPRPIAVTTGAMVRGETNRSMSVSRPVIAITTCTTPQMMTAPWMVCMVVRNRSSGSSMLCSCALKMTPKVGVRYANEPPWTIGRRSPSVVCTSVLMPEMKKMVLMVCARSFWEPPIAGTRMMGITTVAPSIVR